MNAEIDRDLQEEFEMFEDTGELPDGWVLRTAELEENHWKIDYMLPRPGRTASDVSMEDGDVVLRLVGGRSEEVLVKIYDGGERILSLIEIEYPYEMGDLMRLISHFRDSA